MRSSSSALVTLIFAAACACSDRPAVGGDAAAADTGPRDGPARREASPPDAPRADAGRDSDADTSLTDAERPQDGPSFQDAGPTACTLVVATVNGQPLQNVPQLDSSLDKQASKPGIQIDVGVRVIGAPSGTRVTLAVTGVSPDTQADSVLGVATYAGLSVNPNLTRVELSASALGCLGDTVSLNVQPDPSCQITAPANGSTLTSADDSLPGNDTFESNVVVTTNSRSIGGIVRLTINGRDLGTRNVPTNARAIFDHVAFGPSPSVTLTATLTLGRLQTRCSATVVADVPGPACEIASLVLPPAEPVQTAQGLGLGPSEDENGDPSDGLQTTITVATDDSATRVTLREGSAVLGTVTPSGGVATFERTLSDGPHRLGATCTDSGETSNRSEANVLVDVTPPAAVGDLLCFVRCLDTTCPTGDLSLSDNRRGIITCRFSSVDGTGSPVREYVLRYRDDERINDANWDDAGTRETILTPITGVLTQTHQVSGFSIPHSYAFALRVVDTLGNVSETSNLPEPLEVSFRRQVLSGEAAGDRFGTRIVVGDFSCDGLTDVAIGEASQGSNNQGRVQIFAGTTDGLATTPASVISGTIDEGFFGIGLARLDFNGDGCDDLAVRASGQDTRRGRIYLYLGRDPFPAVRTDMQAGTGAEAVYTLPPGDETSTQRLGQAIAGVDLDGDGKDELAMTHWDTDNDRFASVRVDYGDDQLALVDGDSDAPAARAMPASAELSVVGGSYTDSFANLLDRGGLLDRGSDTHQELLIGAPKHAVGGTQVGALYVLKGGPRGASGELIDVGASPRVVMIAGNAASENNLFFGGALAGLGDVDGDGIAEFAAADPLRGEGPEAQIGKVYIFNLDPPAPQSTLDARAMLFNGFESRAGNLLGRNIANGADVDPRRGADISNDLLPDILVGMFHTGSTDAGSVHVFLGQLGELADRSTDEADTRLVPPAGDTTPFYSVALTFLGDVNGDGFVDVIAGDSGSDGNTGRVVIFN